MIELLNLEHYLILPIRGAKHSAAFDNCYDWTYLRRLVNLSKFKLHISCVNVDRIVHVSPYFGIANNSGQDHIYFEEGLSNYLQSFCQMSASWRFRAKQFCRSLITSLVTEDLLLRELILGVTYRGGERVKPSFFYAFSPDLLASCIRNSNKLQIVRLQVSVPSKILEKDNRKMLVLGPLDELEGFIDEYARYVARFDYAGISIHPRDKDKTKLILETFNRYSAKFVDIEMEPLETLFLSNVNYSLVGLHSSLLFYGKVLYDVKCYSHSLDFANINSDYNKLLIARFGSEEKVRKLLPCI